MSKASRMIRRTQSAESPLLEHAMNDDRREEVSRMIKYDEAKRSAPAPFEKLRFLSRGRSRFLQAADHLLPREPEVRADFLKEASARKVAVSDFVKIM